MPNLSKQLLLYNGYDQVPVNDYTTDTAWQQTEFGNNATNGEGAESTWVVDVPLGDIPDKRGATGTKYISPHNRMKLFVGSNTIWRGRVAGQTFERGPTRGTYPQEFRVTTSDPNSELEGMVVHNWVRGAETDVARVQGLVASYLSASPRPSTVLNDSNYVVTGSNTVAMAAKTYTAVTPAEVLQEIARFADKDMFVDVDDNLHYHGHDYTGFDSPLRISDDLADLNANTLLPIEPKANEEALDQITVLRSYFGADEVQKSVQVTDNSHLLTTDYWEDLFYDEDSITTAAALVAARQALAPRRLDQITYTVRVGMPGVIQDGNGTPMRGDFCYMLKAGMRIQFKSRAVRGGIANNGSRIGDVFQTVHIREVRWTFPGPDQYFADLTLERPIRPFRGRAQPAATTPKPAPACEPDTPGAAIHTWDFAADTNPSFDNETGLVGIQLTAEDNASICPFGAAICGWAHSSHNATDQFAVTASTTYTFAADVRWQYGPQDNPASAVYMRWYSSPGVEILPLVPLISFVGRSTGVSYHVTKTVVAPVGATLALLNFRTSVHADNIVWGSAGTEAENDPDCFDYGDSPNESPHFLPSDTIADRLNELSNAIAGLEGTTLDWFIVTDPAYGAVGDGTTDDTAAIQAAIDAAELVNGTVYLPVLNYKITAPLVVDAAIRIIGGSIFATITQATSNTDAIQCTTNAYRTWIENLTLDGPATHASGIGISAVRNLVLTDVLIQDFATGISLGGSSWYSKLYKVLVAACTTGIDCTDGSNNVDMTDTLIATATTGIYVRGTEKVRITGGSVEGCTTYGIRVDSGTNNTGGVTIEGVYFENDSGATDIAVGTVNDTVRGGMILGNKFTNGVTRHVDIQYAEAFTIGGNDFRDTGSTVRIQDPATGIVILPNRNDGTYTTNSGTTIIPDDLGGTHPDLAAHDTLGVATQAELDAHAATDHGGGMGAILITSEPAGSPLVFADLLQNSEGTDLLYASE